MYLDFQGTAVRVASPKNLDPSVPAMKAIQVPSASVAAVHCLYGDTTKARQRDIGDWQQIRMPQ